MVNLPKRNETIHNQALMLYNLTERLKGKNIIFADNKKTIDELSEENQKINLHLNQSRRNVKIFGIGGIAVGIISTLILQK